jgi:transcriptional regulator with XRE-family HTH domain
MATTFGIRIRARRVELGLSLNDLARLLDRAGDPISPQGIQAWESGRTSPTVDRVARVAAVLGVTPADLLDGDSDGDGEVA